MAPDAVGDLPQAPCHDRPGALWWRRCTRQQRWSLSDLCEDLPEPSDGGVFGYGDAQFYGSTGGLRLNKSVVGMAAAPGGNGSWLVASHGGIFTYGDAQLYGSAGSLSHIGPVNGMARTADGNGYWLTAASSTRATRASTARPTAVPDTTVFRRVDRP
jgi:hypothetical protein